MGEFLDALSAVMVTKQILPLHCVQGQDDSITLKAIACDGLLSFLCRMESYKI